MAKPPQIRPLRDFEVGRTDVEQLVEVADDLRQLKTEFGLRPYRVFLVWVGWTADEDRDRMIRKLEVRLDPSMEGVGRPVLLRVDELLPTPRKSAMTGVQKVLEATGDSQEGSIRVDQVSVSYPEDLLVGLAPEFRDPENPGTMKKGITFFWEIQEQRPARHRFPNTAAKQPNDLPPVRTRFAVASKPNRRPFQWEVDLAAMDGERGRFGEVEVIG